MKISLQLPRSTRSAVSRARAFRPSQPRYAMPHSAGRALADRLRPGTWVALCLLVFTLAWLVQFSLSGATPPTDNIEQLTWAHSLEWGYYKHPPLPTWLIWLPVQILGNAAHSSYFSALVCNLASVIVLWRLLTRLRGERFGADRWARRPQPVAGRRENARLRDAAGRSGRSEPGWQTSRRRLPWNGLARRADRRPVCLAGFCTLSTP